MDIYSYIPSFDVADYCRTINHKFNTIEMAYIIDKSDRTIKQKNVAFQELIDNYPNMEFHESVKFKGGSNIHDYLKALIKFRETFIKDFENPNITNKTFYSYSRFDAKLGFDNQHEGKSFSTLDELWDFIQPYMLKHNIDSVCVLRGMTKRHIDRVVTIYNINREAIYIHDKQYLNRKYELAKKFPDGPGPLWQLFVDIPIPFKKGDIINYSGKPAVLKALPYSAKEYPKLESGSIPSSESPDFAVFYYLDKNGNLKDSFPDSYGFGESKHRIEYYKLPLKEDEKVLFDLSNRIKNN